MLAAGRTTCGAIWTTAYRAVSSGLLFGAAPCAEVEDRQQARPAMRADDDAERRDRNAPNFRDSLGYLIADPFGISVAIGMQDMNLGAGRGG